MIKILMKNRPIISVITVSRNRVYYFQQLIQSLANQKFKDFELIIIENASDDETKHYVSSIEIKDIEVKKIYFSKEETISTCRNYAFKNKIVAQTVKYIYFIDDDDLIFENTLKKLYNCIITEKADFVFGTTFKVYSSGNLLNNIYSKISYSSLLKNLLRNSWVVYVGKVLFPSKQWLLIRHCILLGIHSILLDKKILELNRFDELVNYGEDSLFWYKISSDIKKYKSLPTAIVPYRLHGDNTFDQHNYINKNKCLVNTFEFYEKNNYSKEEKYLVLYIKYLQERYIQFENNFMHNKFDNSFIIKFQQLSETINFKIKLKACFFFIFPIVIRYAKICKYLINYYLRNIVTMNEKFEINLIKNIRLK